MSDVSQPGRASRAVIDHSFVTSKQETLVTTILESMPAVKNPLDPWITLGEEPGVAPAHLEGLRALLNTDDRFHGVDRLADAPALVRELRDAVRAYAVSRERARIDELASAHPVRVTFVGDDPALISTVPDDVVGPVLVAVLEATRTGEWARLKACANPDCQWIYYDTSRNRSGRWCSMGECGDVMKARAYRERARSR